MEGRSGRHTTGNRAETANRKRGPGAECRASHSDNILLEGLPKGLRLTDVTTELSGVPGVIDVHDLHIWSLGSEAHALSCHVRIEDMPPSASESILKRINEVLCDRFAIHHTTVQFEHAPCALTDVSCTVAKQHQH